MSRTPTYTLTALESAMLLPWAGAYLSRSGVGDGFEGVAREVMGLTSARHVRAFFYGEGGISYVLYQRLLNTLLRDFPATAAALDLVSTPDTHVMLIVARDYIGREGA